MVVVAASKPDWIIFLLGTNDAKSFGFAPDRSLVSADETTRNVEILDAAARETGARVIWLLPPLAAERVAAESAFWSSMNVMWANKHLIRAREAISRAVPALDVQAWFSESGAADLLLDDGLHPSAEGQSVILSNLLGHLVTIADSRSGSFKSRVDAELSRLRN